MFQKSTNEEIEKRLLEFIRNAGYKTPTLLQKHVLPSALQERDIIVEAGPGEGRTGLFIVSLLMQTERSGGNVRDLIVTADAGEVYKVMRQYRKFSTHFRGRPHITGVGADENMEKEIRLLFRKPDIVVGTSARIIDHLRRENITLGDVKNVVLIVPDDPELAGFDKDVQYIFSKLPEKCSTQVYCPNLETMSKLSTVLKRPSQITKTEWCRDNDLNGKERNVGKKTKERSDAHSGTVEHIKSVLRAINETVDPRELNEFRRVFRRHTPLHLRAYFAAYLIKEAVGSTPSTPSGGSRTLFVSIGKNRKVFPKDFIKLFTTQLGITETELGDIKVLDNYSFIDIAEPYAQKAIDALNSTEFRGRKITVNYARKRREKRS